MDATGSMDAPAPTPDLEHPCERCGARERVHTERFCRVCKQSLIGEMARCGYLTRVPTGPRRRTRDEMQAPDTGYDPWLENAIRELEEA